MPAWKAFPALNKPYIFNSLGHHWSPKAANIQKAIDDLPAEGGKVWLPGKDLGTCPTTTIPSGVHLFGAGYATKVDQDGDTHVFQNEDNATDIRISNFRIVGSGSSEYVFAIYFKTAITRSIIDHMFITGVGTHAIDTRGFTEGIIAENMIWGNGDGIIIYASPICEKLTVIGNVLYDNGVNDIVIRAGMGISVVGNVCGKSWALKTGCGIRLDGAVRCMVLGNIVQFSEYRGMWIRNAAEHNVVANNLISSAGWHGLHCDGSNYNAITGNQFYYNNYAGVAGTYDDIRISDSLYSLIKDNVCVDPRPTKVVGYGIRTEGTSDYNIIHGNISRAADHLTGGILNVGVNDDVAHNIT